MLTSFIFLACICIFHIIFSFSHLFLQVNLTMGIVNELSQTAKANPFGLPCVRSADCAAPKGASGESPNIYFSKDN